MGGRRQAGQGPLRQPDPGRLRRLCQQVLGRVCQDHRLFRLLDICEDLDVAATVALSGILAETNPELFERAAANGRHALLAHSWSQDRYHAYMDRDEEDAEIKRCIKAFEDAAGRRPLGYGCPRGALSADTPELLRRNGFTWMQDFLDSDVPYDVETPAGAIVNIPYNMAINDLPLYVRRGNPTGTFAGNLAAVLDGWGNIGAPHYVLDISAHCHVLGRPTSAVEFHQAIDMARKHEAVWMTTRDEIAEVWARHKTA